MIETSQLTKRYGHKLAVDQLSVQIQPGRVTGFLGPNGAGKSTTLRLILGLDAPTGGSATVNGRPYRQLPVPLREVGALLDTRAVHGGRTAHDHLLCLAHSNRIPRQRVGQVLEVAGLANVADTRVKGFSLGMGQRLGIAAALLGDPGVLVLDEPVNGLDTDGIRWIRDLLRGLAGEGRTVLVSSHLMSEMELTADHLIVIGQAGCWPTPPCERSSRATPRPPPWCIPPSGNSCGRCSRPAAPWSGPSPRGAGGSAGQLPRPSAPSPPPTRSSCTSCHRGSPPSRRSTCG